MQLTTLDTSADRHLKHTTSLCPVCKEQIDAEVVQRGKQVVMKKHCAAHGHFEATLSTDDRFYHLSHGADTQPTTGCNCSAGACCTPAPVGHNAGIVEHSSTCIALIEIVESCNLSCPTCYADSPQESDATALPVEDIQQRIQSVIDRKGMIDILQLSGGEPTIHPRFFDVMRWALQHSDIGYVLLNTNGVRLAAEPGFVEQLGELRRDLKKFEVYLQYDGPQEAGQIELRGKDLRALRSRVLDRCGDLGIPVTLAMTVDGHNADQLGETLRLAIKHPAIRGITFQPMFGSGRAYEGVNLTVNGSASTTPEHKQHPPTQRLSVADIALGLIDQSNHLLSENDFTPLPCGDPNCHTVGYLLRRGDTALPVSRLVDFKSMQGFLKDRIDFNLEDLSKCGCESEPLGEVLKQLEIGPDDVLRLFIKPFMDAWTYDQHRIDRCCVHVVGEGGSLESFCRHYAMR
ncbi:MAG: radical SAM protein [Phycisphaeraceae bacterium]|nr:radical SAM protein [Phycisphaeraceae bacterium]